MLKLPDLDAVAICTPPQVRHDIAKQVLLAGKSALLEKPPAATLSELEDLKRIAATAGKTLFTAWHAQHNDGVDAAAKALKGQTIKRLLITWKEDVRQWHPGQEWIWQAGGFGVFDPGINALSILSRIAPQPIFVRQATLEFPVQPRRADRSRPRFRLRSRWRGSAGGVRLAPDRPADLGYRDRHGRRASTCC